MNDFKRRKLDLAVKHLQNAEDIINSILDMETDARDNVPEQFQETDRYVALENATDELSDALSSVSEAIEHIENAAA